MLSSLSSKPSLKPSFHLIPASGFRSRVIHTVAIFCLAAMPHFARAATASTTSLAITAGAQPVSTVAPRTVITLTATVTAAGTPVNPGQVTFCDAAVPFCTDIHALGTAQLTLDGTATIRFVARLGNHSYKAVFLGTHLYSGSSSAAQSCGHGTCRC